MITGILKNTWSIFLGIAFLMLGNGLQGTLTGWRATYEGFPASTTGWIMTGYYIGFLVGSIITPVLVRGVGHIRVFAAMASVASTAVLIQILFISPPVWIIMRLLTGFCFAGAYVIVESWLNARSDNNTRGRIMSFYMLISLFGMAAGQWLMKAAHPSSITLFLVASILLSFALVPVLISRIKAPDIELHHSISVFELWKLAKSGPYTILFAAMAHGAMFGMGAVYAVKSVMTVSDTVIFMTSFILFGAIFQWPVGWLSDLIDRRFVIIMASVLATTFCVSLFTVDLSANAFLLAFGLLGAMSLPLYSLGVTLTNDQLQPEQMVGASSSIILILGFGSMLGPISVGYLMDFVGLQGFFMHLALMHSFIAIGCIYFVWKYPPVAKEELTHYQLVPPRATIVAMETIAQEAEESQTAEDSSE